MDLIEQDSYRNQNPKDLELHGHLLELSIEEEEAVEIKDLKSVGEKRNS